MSEIWRDIAGWVGYQVSNLGGVRSLDRISINSLGRKYMLKGAVLNPVLNNNGYKVITVCYDGKRMPLLMHRLVAEHFLPNPNDLPEVNHKDRDRANNREDNLEWSSKRENRTHSKIITNKSSSYSGLTYRKDSKKWRVRLCLDNKIKTIGNFKSEVEAAKAYLNALEAHWLTNKYAKAA